MLNSAFASGKFIREFARMLEFPIPYHIFSLAPIGLPVAMILYYLAWKYLVSSLNAELGIC